MNNKVTTFLDALGILLLAAGGAAATYRWLGWGCLAVAGVIVLGGSALATYLNEPREDDESIS